MTNKSEPIDPLARGAVSFEAALHQRGISLANQSFLKNLSATINIAGCVPMESYIKVERVEGGPALQVHAGYTNGFRSAEEIRHIFGEVDLWPSQRFDGAWGVTHPDSGIGRADNREKSAEIIRKVCPTCFILMAASGVCSSCE
ncbi:hypothetical protein JOF28_001075 [Leucobacter exalbidus]|uniref:Uncharacterized protein n=1 Tax=Leucobacter exalbidus TaxID=662960 RepID=A0A940PS92_9MICO|nr:hypothetical protein [Leucobacter exalbidus]MBP1325843.1 hypothetical protein [Leucobacter exalbidus]